MNAVHQNLRRLIAAASVLATCWLSGCACHDVPLDHCALDQCAGESFVVWPCFGYHSTCWRPWPGECIACPSPYSPLGMPGEVVPVPPPGAVPEGAPGLSPLPLPTPEAAPPAPTAPPADPLPGDNSQFEPSSRRRAESQVQYLQSLRWAPAGSR